MTGDYDDLCSTLEAVAEALTDRSIERLRASLEDGGHAFPQEEKELTRARRSIEKAVTILRRLDEPTPGGDPWA